LKVYSYIVLRMKMKKKINLLNQNKVFNFYFNFHFHLYLHPTLHGNQQSHSQTSY
jgi:hypothetical protein